jgi:rubrerythrin
MQNEQIHNGETRRLFAFGAGLAGLALAGARSAAAQSTGTNPDIAVLNYALALEHLEANFYTVGLQRFTASDFNRASFARILGSGTVNGVYANLGRIRDHEVAHVQALEAAIRSLGGTPVSACSYSFPYSDPESFLQVATTLEETGVAAYNGALATITAAGLKAAGASIATVEARHAAYLQLVMSNIPFPKAFDDAKTQQEILAAVSAFITSCPTGSTPGSGSGATTRAVLNPKNATVVVTQISLDATQSTAADGRPLRYMTRATGKPASISMADTPTPMVQFNGVGQYTFELTVTDSTGATSTDTTTINYVGTR